MNGEAAAAGIMTGDSAWSGNAPSVSGEDIRVAYKGRTVVSVDAIDLPAGKTFALLGASGAGKSTLLRVLGLLERPTRGLVSIDGRPARWRDLNTRRTIAAVFQKPFLLRGNVADNVGYGLRLRGVRGAERSKRIEEVLARVGLDGWQERSALTLSGGEAQRIALARALVLRPRMLLLDEPLSYMDPLLKRQLTVEFANILAGEHVTSLYVTHDQDEARVVADVIAIMRDGRIVAHGDPDTVLAMPGDAWQASFLGMEPSLDGVVVASEGGTARIDCGGLEIFAITDAPVGAKVEVGVRPEDILLFEPGIELPLSSARNSIDGTVVEIAPMGATARVVVESGGARLASSVSTSSARSLGLSPGSPVRLLFKATAVSVRRCHSTGV